MIRVTINLIKPLTGPEHGKLEERFFQAIFSSDNENYKKLSENPLSEALKSYKKALELDDKNRNDNAV